MHETQTPARFVAESRWDDIPQTMRHEAKRALLNWMGCALGGCRDETVKRAAIRQLMAPPEPKKKRSIGFLARVEK